MLLHAMLGLEPFGAFNAIPLPKAREILCWLAGFVLGQMPGRTEICVNLVKVSTQIFVSQLNSSRDNFVYLVLRFVFTLRRAPIMGSSNACPEAARALEMVW